MNEKHVQVDSNKHMIVDKHLDLTGKTIGQWKVGERIHVPGKRKSYFVCECLNCGTKRIVRGTALNSGASLSCGCMSHSENAKIKRKQTSNDKLIFTEDTSVVLIKRIRNGKLMSNNKSGCTGVSQKGNRWIAEITCQGVYHYLGSHMSYEEAVQARKKAEEEYFGKILNKISEKENND